MPERILVVEDDRFFRETFYHLLTGEGYEVDTVPSPLEALECLDNKAYQLVVSDLLMPEMTGLDLLFRVKQRDPDIDVILVTGNGNIETAIHALKNGARDYLIKPINYDEFKHAVSLCFEQKRLLNENTELKGLVHLFQVGQTIANCLDLDRLYPLILDSIAKEVGSERVIGLFLDGESKPLFTEIRGFDTEEGERVAETVIPYCLSHQGAACERLDDMLSSGASVTDCLRAKLKEALVLMVRSKTALHGIILLFRKQGEKLPSEVNYTNINFILDQSSLAFENATRYATAKNLLYIDELTGLFNYRYLDMALEREIKRAERYASSVTVIFIDLDLFKDVNDRHGHLVGSSVLREVGKLLRSSVRDVDLVIRYGGDEYTIILVETNTSGAASVAERIRSTIESHRFLADEGYEIRLTACLGYASYPEDTKSKKELLDVADQAMYRGKANGRNRVYRALQR